MSVNRKRNGEFIEIFKSNGQILLLAPTNASINVTAFIIMIMLTLATIAALGRAMFLAKEFCQSAFRSTRTVSFTALQCDTRGPIFGVRYPVRQLLGATKNNSRLCTKRNEEALH